MNNEEKQMMASVARRVKEIRTSKLISQHRLSELTGIQQSNLCSYETGSIKISLTILIKLAAGLQCSLDYLLGIEVSHNTETLQGRLGAAISKLKLHEQETAVRMIEFLALESK